MAAMKFWRKKLPAAPEPERVEPPVTAQPIVISDAVWARAKRRATPPRQIFTVPSHPPSATPKDKSLQIAQDSVSAAQSWANAELSQALGSIFSEGLSFLGYPFLAELAQRPEYRVISETIASEMTRKWIRFTSTSDDDDDKDQRLKDLKKEFDRLDVAGMFGKATEQDGFFGRGHIYIDTGDGENPDELSKSIGDGSDSISKAKIAKGSIKALRTVEAVWCYPTTYNSNDPLADDWYRPNEWFVQGKIVHSSRLITLIGREVPDLLKPTYSFGGLSLSQMVKPYVDNWLETRQGVNDIIQAFTTWVLKTDLSSVLKGDGAQLFRRVELFNDMRSNQGTMVLNKDTEDFQAVSAPLSGLDTLQAQAQEHMASVSHIPTVKLLGIQPAGLNASSEDQMRVFYDWIGSYQEKLYRKPIRRIMKLVQLSLWNEIHDDIDFVFEPLWALDEKGQAEVEKTKAETDQIFIDAGVLSPEESRKRIASDAESGYSSIDVEELPDLRDEEEEGLEPPGGRPDPALTGEEGEDPQGLKNGPKPGTLARSKEGPAGDPAGPNDGDDDE